MESQRVGHDLTTKQKQHPMIHIHFLHSFSIELFSPPSTRMFFFCLIELCDALFHFTHGLQLQSFCVFFFFFFKKASLVTQMVKNLPAVQETWVRSLGQEDPLEKEIATHSSILAWRIPRTEKPGGLQFMGSQRGQTRLSN